MIAGRIACCMACRKRNFPRLFRLKWKDGSPCCDWVGEGGAGHFVKMVHNGIEYGDMQIICEAYQLMKEMLGLSADEMHDVFKKYNEGDPGFRT